MSKNPYYISVRTWTSGGGGEIRTHGPVAQTPVFKTGALDHSATPPKAFGFYFRWFLYKGKKLLVATDALLFAF